MQQFDCLTEQQLIALGDDDIQRYIDYACAENGVALLPATLPEPPKTEVPSPDTMAFTVGASYSHDIVCASLADAQRVADLLNSIVTVSLNYMPGASLEKVMEPKRGPYMVTPTPCFSGEVAASVRPALADAERAKKLYDAAKTAFDKISSERQSYADEIREKVADAWETHNRREARRRDYARYLSLSDGNEDIALRFLVRAYPDVRELLPDLFAQKVAAAEVLQ